MLKLHTWSTQNARKISIMLEECGLDYEIEAINLEEDEQFQDSFKLLNPNSKIPVLTDSELTDELGKAEPIFETGAILLYLAEKSGQFLSTNPAIRMRTIKWLFWQTSGLGPALGNFSHYASALAKDEKQLNNYLLKTRATDPNMQAIERFSKEVFRLLGVLNSVLQNNDYIAGEVSIADFACYSWIESAWFGLQKINPQLSVQFANVHTWLDRLAARPGVSLGMEKLDWRKQLSSV